MGVPLSPLSLALPMLARISCLVETELAEESNNGLVAPTWPDICLRSAPLPPGTVDTEDCWELMEGPASSVPRVLSRFPLPVETLELSVLPTPE